MNRFVRQLLPFGTLILLIAALSAEGTSTNPNIEQLDRGYQNIDRRLQSLGAAIQRVD